MKLFGLVASKKMAGSEKIVGSEMKVRSACGCLFPKRLGSKWKEKNEWYER